MAEQHPLDRAERMISDNPMHKAAYRLGFAVGDHGNVMLGYTCPDCQNKAAAYLLLAETPPEPGFHVAETVHPETGERMWSRVDAPPEPAKAWTVDEAQTLFTRAQRIADAKDQLANVMLQLHFRDLDPTARAATEGALNVACAKLAALVGGAK